MTVLIGWPTSLSAAPVARLSHRTATAQLKAAGITWASTGDCSDRDNPQCTSFERIRQSTIDGVITLKTASGCPVTITGGTEIGHGTGTYTHWNGWKVDIARRSCVGGYITGNFTFVGHISGWGDQYRAPSGNLYTDEGDHWDILYYTCGGCAAPAEPTPVPSSPSVTPSPAITPSPVVTGSPAPSVSPTVSPAATSAAPSGPPPVQPGPEPEPSGPPVVDPLRIADHLG